MAFNVELNYVKALVCRPDPIKRFQADRCSSILRSIRLSVGDYIKSISQVQVERSDTTILNVLASD